MTEEKSKWWQCPKCPYRIHLKHPGGCNEAIREHKMAHEREEQDEQE
jgi:hypothetical protein